MCEEIMGGLQTRESVLATAHEASLSIRDTLFQDVVDHAVAAQCEWTSGLAKDYFSYSGAAIAGIANIQSLSNGDLLGNSAFATQEPVFNANQSLLETLRPTWQDISWEHDIRHQVLDATVDHTALLSSIAAYGVATVYPDTIIQRRASQTEALRTEVALPPIAVPPRRVSSGRAPALPPHTLPSQEPWRARPYMQVIHKTITSEIEQLVTDHDATIRLRFACALRHLLDAFDYLLNSTKASIDAVSFLYHQQAGGKGQNAKERDLEQFLLQWLAALSSTSGFKVRSQASDIAGGRCDILIDFFEQEFPIEIKAERNNTDREWIRHNHLSQAQSYAAISGIGFLFVMDLTEKYKGQPLDSHPDRCYIDRVNTGGTSPSWVVVLVVPCNRLRPSDHSRYS